VSQDLPELHRVAHAELSPDGKRALVVGERWEGQKRSTAVLLWQRTPQGGGLLRELILPDKVTVNRVALSADRNSLRVAAAAPGVLERHPVDGTPREFQALLWDAAAPQPASLAHVVAQTMAAQGLALGANPLAAPAHLAASAAAAADVSPLCVSATLRPPDNAPVWHVAFSPDGGWLITCGGLEKGETGSAHLWGAGLTGRQTVPYASYPHDGAVRFAAFSGTAGAPSDRVVTCGDDKVIVWDLNGGGGHGKILTHGNSVSWADFSPDGRRVVTADRDRKAQVWDVQSGSLAFPPLDHSGTVSRVAFGPEGRRVVSICSGVDEKGKELSVAQVWELRRKDVSWHLPTDGRVTYAGGDLFGGCLVAVDARQGQTQVRGWKTVPAPLYELNVPPPASFHPILGNAGVSFAAANAAGDRVVALSGKTAYLWDTATNTLLRKEAHAVAVNHACFTPDDKLVIATGDEGEKNGQIKFWDGRTGKDLESPRCAGDCWAFLFAAVSRDGKWLVATGGPPLERAADDNDEAWAVLWPVGSPNDPVELRGTHKEPVTFATFSTGSRYLVTASRDNTACVWRVEADGGPPGSPKKHMKQPGRTATADVVHAEFSRDGKHLVTAAEDGTAIVWDVSDGRALMTLEHGTRGPKARFSPDGRCLITGGQSGQVRVWQVQASSAEKGQPRPSPLLAALEHPGAVLDVAFSPDGKRFRVVSRQAPLGDAQAQPPFPAGGDEVTAPRPPRAAGAPGSPTQGPGLWLFEWKVEPGSQDPDEVGGMAAVTARRRFDQDTQGLATLTLDELRSLWGRSERPLRDTFRLRDGMAEVRYSAWEAHGAEAAGLWAAARWHLDRAIDRLKWPGEQGMDGGLRADLHARRADVTDKLRHRPFDLRRPMGSGEDDFQKVIGDYDEAIRAADQTDAVPRADLFVKAALARLSASVEADLYGVPRPDKEKLVRDAEGNYEQAQRLGRNDPQVEVRLGDGCRSLVRGRADPDGYRERAASHYRRAFEVFRWAEVRDPVVYLSLSWGFLDLARSDAKRWPDVIDACTAGLMVQSDKEASADLRLRRAEALERKEPPDYAAAIDDLLAAARLRGNDETAIRYLMKALDLARKRDPRRLAEILRASGLRYVARARVVPAQWVNVIKYLEEAAGTQELSKDWEVWAELGHAYEVVWRTGTARTAEAHADEMLGKWKAAAWAYERALAADPPRPEVAGLLRQLARAYSQARDWPGAIDAYKRALELPRDRSERAGLLVQLAWAHRQAKDWPGAIDAYTRALELRPNDAGLLADRAALLATAGRLEEMSKDYDAILKGNPEATWVRMTRASAWAQHDRWKEAAEDLQAVVDRSPQGSQVWYQLALAQLRLGRPRAYRATRAKMLERFERTANAYDANQTAWVIALADPPEEERARAAELAKAAVKLGELAVKGAPTYANVNTLGVALYRAGDDEAALKKLDEARKAYKASYLAPPGATTDNGSATDQAFLALIYHRLGKKDEAKEWLKKATDWLQSVDRAKVSVWQYAEWKLHLEEAQRVIGPVE
jgi:WD40 repeat protein/tetratricopeptide (TPR) repeat protein